MRSTATATALLATLFLTLTLAPSPVAGFIPHDAEDPHATTSIPLPAAPPLPNLGAVPVPRSPDGHHDDDSGGGGGDGFEGPVLERRQGGVAVTATAATTVATQVSPVTTYYINSYVGGVATYVPVTFTQTFASVPDQWSSASSGSIGLGTIEGTVGVVKTTTSK